MATVEQIKQEITDYANEAYGYNSESFTTVFYEFVEELGYSKNGVELKSGTAKKVKFIDAGEGDYSAAILIVFSINDQLFRVDGRYESWAGSEWESEQMYEVEPVEVKVIDYLRKKG